jgi:RNA polymerase primary sigma factor
MKFDSYYTNSDSQSLVLYLQDISKIPLIDSSEEIELAKKIKTGMGKIRENKLIKANLRFVVSVAKQYQNQGLSLGDLINEGNIGLIKAASKFDDTRGFKFISYAVWWISQSILLAIALNSRTVRLPLNKINAGIKLRKASNGLRQKYEREPTDYELANVLKISVREVWDTIDYFIRDISIDSPDSKDSDNKIVDNIANTDQISPDEKLNMESLKTDLKDILKKLKPNERVVIELYFGLYKENELTLEEIGNLLNITRERVRQIKEKAIRKIKRLEKTQDLRLHLG